jgi:predicted dienelactone hydrolase
VALSLAVGFRQVMLGPIAVNIWYPSDGQGSIRGHHLPLVVMSHGVRGSGYSDSNVALALANAAMSRPR